MHRRIHLTIVAAIALVGQAASAATINVPGDQPTIQAAVTAAAPGDSIVVADGTYIENVNINKNVTLLSVNGRAATTIQGISSAGALGTLQITSNTTALQIGAAGRGFTIDGIDNGNPAVENAAVYFQGAHSNAQVLDNEIVAIGDHGLLTEYGAVISGFVIDGNEFSGQTFIGPNPAGNGFTQQFTLPNVPRQLCVMGGGSGGGSTSNTTFINNTVSGSAGGYNTLAEEQGNTLVTVDSNGATISGNTFAGTTTRYATSLRARGPLTTISGNNFDSSGIQAPLKATGHVYFQNTGETLADIALNNTFDRGVYVLGAIPTATMTWSLAAAAGASPGGTTLDVLPGNYDEQIIVDGKDLTIRGSGAGSTIVESPALLATTFTTSAANKPIITATNSGNIVIRDLTVDGLGLGNANYRMYGIAFWNAGGAVLDCDVVNIIETPWSGTQHGVGIYSFNDTGGPYSIEVGGCTVTDFQKTAIALNGSGVTANVHDCTTVGGGATTITAQNGIQLWGPDGSVTDCSVSDVRYVPTSWVASGLLMYQAGTVAVSNVTLVDAEEAVYFDASGTIDNVNVTYPTISLDYDGIFAANYTTAKRGESRIPAQPFGDAAPVGRSLRGATAVTITNSCVTGPAVPSGVGVYAYSAGQPITVDASGLTITGFDYGCVADGIACSFDINSSSISGNATAGYDNTLSGVAQDASLNWWGAADGPSGDGAGSGDAIVSVGGEVTFSPYLVTGASSTTCAFSPPDNEVTPNPSIPCVSTINPCVPVSFDITRADNADMRGFSVTFTLSPELELCAGLTSITEGSYLNSIGLTTFLALDNGGGSYTVDCSILGTPCGATAVSGDLFNVDVKAAGGDGTGTITVTSVIFRDCTNVPLPAAAGAPASITLDATAPIAVSDLSSTQVTAGNDGDGTTGITLNFTAPGDAAAVEIYRKGYGDYPEYDDGTGAVPTSPTDPADALANGWALTTASLDGDVDETTVRDYYYYVMFTEDDCGNVSGVSNMAGGTLNYHLGDVTNGTTPGAGDNLVGGVDISLLGSNYGITLTHLDPVNYLDVGPTTTFYVDGLPLTDNEVEFEDLMMFAINYNQVSRAPAVPEEIGLEHPDVALVVDSAAPGAGGVLRARVVLRDNIRSVKGIHTVVSFGSRLELLSVERGALLDSQSATIFFADVPNAAGVTVDAAAMGQGMTVLGSGVVAELTFRVVTTGAVPTLADADLRGVRNGRAGRAIAVAPVGGNASPSGLPERLELLAARPNPFDTSTQIVFRLPASSPVAVKIYDVAGRHVRTLVDRTMPPGEHRTTWDGRGVDGRPVGSGIYFYTFRSDGLQETHRLIHTR